MKHAFPSIIGQYRYLSLDGKVADSNNSPSSTTENIDDPLKWMSKADEKET
jgi:hypothetical protein